MYSIVLVDDEKGIVDGLHVLIKRGLTNCNVVGRAYDGTEGLQVCLTKQPDIVITDIRMFQMDGLEMIKQLQVQGFRGQFIILSGYSEFRYAQKGMQLGVKFYINKPVEEDELYDCVQGAIEDIEAERQRKQTIEGLKESVQHRTDHLKTFVFRNILENGGKYIDDMPGLLTAISLPAAAHVFYYCILFAYTDEVDGSLNDHAEQIVQLLNDIFKDRGATHVMRYDSHHYVVVIATQAAMATEQLLTKVKEAEEYIYRSTELIVHGSVGSEQQEIGGLNQSFEAAQIALPRKRDVIDEIKHYLDVNYDKQITLDALSEQFYIHPQYLSTLFKERTGQNYLQYVRERRINRAKELLETSDLKVYEVCEKVGYSDTTHFNRIFTEMVGVRPVQFREIQQNR